jgi:hypothetical protein
MRLLEAIIEANQRAIARDSTAGDAGRDAVN